MKKITFLFIIIINFGISSCNKKTNNNDLKQRNLNGLIVSVNEKYFFINFKFGEPTKGEKDTKGYAFETNTLYDNFGNEIEYYKYDNFGNSFFSKTSYNGKNEKTQTLYFSPIDGKEFGKQTYKYDTDGNCIEFQKYSGITKKTYIQKNEYDDDHNIIKELFKFQNESDFSQYIFSYNHKNEKIQSIEFGQKTEFIYFENGDIKDIVLYSKDGEIEKRTSFTYKYDNNKNWNIRITYENGTALSYTERKIEYKK